jgi:hypothetical protein
MFAQNIIFLILISLTISQDFTTYYMTMEKGAEPTIYSENKLVYITVNIEAIKNKSATDLIFYLYPSNIYNYIKVYLSFDIPQPSFDDMIIKLFLIQNLVFIFLKKNLIILINFIFV